MNRLTLQVPLRAAALLACFAATTAAQNVLSPTAWTAWNPSALQNLQLTQDRIFFTVVSQAPTASGIEQTFAVTQGGLYQFTFAGAGGLTGVFSADWAIDGQPLDVFVNGSSFETRSTRTLMLAAGSHTVRLTSSTSTLSEDSWVMVQPELRPVVDPTCRVTVIGRDGNNPFPALSLAADADYVVMSLGRLGTPIALPGLAGPLELDPAVGIDVLAQGSGGRVSLDLSAQLAGLGPVPTFHLQAIRLGAAPALGSRATVEGRFLNF